MLANRNIRSLRWGYPDESRRAAEIAQLPFVPASDNHEVASGCSELRQERPREQEVMAALLREDLARDGDLASELREHRHDAAHCAPI